MADITPLIPKGRKVIESYGDGGFTISEEKYNGSVIVFAGEVVEWNVKTFKELSLASLSTIQKRKDDIEILLIGCGNVAEFLDEEILEGLKKSSIVADVMDTGAACRTYNVLLSEERKVAATLIAV